MEYNRLERAEQEYVMQKEAEERKRKEEEKVRAQASEEKKQEEQRRKIEEERNKRNASCREICEQCGPDARREGTQQIEVTSVRMLNSKREMCQSFSTGEPIILELEYKKNIDRDIYGSISVGITRKDWIYCAGFSLRLEIGQEYKFEQQEKLELKIDNTLLDSTYHIDVSVETREKKIDVLNSIISFKVANENKKLNIGVNEIKHQWVSDKKEIRLQ